MDRTFLTVGAIAGLVGVALVAFGAHGLRGRLSPDMLAVFETGVRYQMYHALAILAIAVLTTRMEGRLLTAAGWLFSAGIVLFSGSLYVLALTGVDAKQVHDAEMLFKWKQRGDISVAPFDPRDASPSQGVAPFRSRGHRAGDCSDGARRRPFGSLL